MGVFFSLENIVIFYRKFVSNFCDQGVLRDEGVIYLGEGVSFVGDWVAENGGEKPGWGCGRPSVPQGVP